MKLLLAYSLFVLILTVRAGREGISLLIGVSKGGVWAVSVVIRRLEEALRRAPRSGYKASMYTGLVSKLASMAQNAARAVELAECIGVARELCGKSRGAVVCGTGCAGIYLVAADGDKRVMKVGGNAVGIRVSEGLVEVKSKRAGILLEPGRLSIILPSSGGWETITVNLADVDDVISKYHFIKYAVQRVDWNLNVTLRDLTSCSRRSGLTC